MRLVKNEPASSSELDALDQWEQVQEETKDASLELFSELVEHQQLELEEAA